MAPFETADGQNWDIVEPFIEQLDLPPCDPSAPAGPR